MVKRLENKELQLVTSYIKHLAVSALSNVSVRFKCTFDLTSNCFEMRNDFIP
ncbi:MAG: hypothetical protein WBI87_05990 [Bacteroidales bacterium]|jgi:hypothetical protein